ncbi:MAG: multicopper oxidase domain-containing protein [Chloroflexia bacterium]|nr:multicopper oxidase domain-containing protein [Chloroflexia bacterium]
MFTRRSKLTRRALIAGGGVLGCCAVVGAGGATTLLLANRLTNQADSTFGELAFATPLDIPPLLEGEPDADGRKIFDLTLQTGRTRIVPAGEAETWGVNGPFLGPTLRARRGDAVAIAVHNDLPEETSIHWHGMHLPAVMDGGLHQMIAAGESWDPEWTVDQPAATLWYHPHPHGQTAEHVYRGIAGLFLIEDDSDGLDLPREYGIDDIPLIIQDKNFTDDGEMSMDTGSFFDQLGGSANFGILGDTVLVNGTWDPYLDVTRSLVRFRILNGSNARFYNLGFDDDRPFRLIATDNGFVPGEPVELTRLLLGPGERVEIVVAFGERDDVVLRSYAQDGLDRQIGGNDSFDILNLRAANVLEPKASLPDDMGVAGQAPAVPDDATRRDFRLNGHGNINGEEMDISRIDEVVPAKALEIWNIESVGIPHTFHIHGATCRVLEVNGEEAPAHLRGPKDTVFVGPDHAVTLAVQFDTHVDPGTPYMYHCHILRHEDNGMMGQFVVVEPGTEADVPMTIDSYAHH